MDKDISNIEYGEELIVVVKHKNEWAYYLSDKDLWIMDQKAWAYSFHEAGYEVPLDDYSDRFDIALLDVNTAEKFLNEMRGFKVSIDKLEKLLLSNDATGKYEDVIQYFPALYLDFDSKELISYFPEPFPFEEYIPSEWTSSYDKFYDKIPSTLQYWKVETCKFEIP